jgi:5-formyltetrahydrofolate cyclo-ligase
MCNVFLSDDIYKDAKCIMLYMPLGNEADTSTVIKKAYVDGKKVVFPVTDRDTGIITPVYAEKDAIFSKGAFSVREPDGGVVAQLCDIDIILVPGIVFDRAGHRIGFGKGCYDKLLTDFKGIKIGFCYSEQICDVVPEDEFDICMDYIISQDGIIKCN